MGGRQRTTLFMGIGEEKGGKEETKKSAESGKEAKKGKAKGKKEKEK